MTKRIRLLIGLVLVPVLLSGCIVVPGWYGDDYDYDGGYHHHYYYRDRGWYGERR